MPADPKTFPCSDEICEGPQPEGTKFRWSPNLYRNDERSGGGTMGVGWLLSGPIGGGVGEVEAGH
jgi:hypothetical protein